MNLDRADDDRVNGGQCKGRVSEGAQLRLWRVQRLAGLRRWSPSLTTYANQLVEPLHAQNSLRPHGLP